MSKALIMAAELIKEECNKHELCNECFYGCKDERGFINCIVDDYEHSPNEWDLLELEKKEC